MEYSVGVRAKTFEDLLVWKKAHAYVLEIYRITKEFPKSEIFGLTAQMRRAAVSMPANIAEGLKKRTPREKIRILNISQGSLEESRYYLILAEDLDYANTAVFLPKLEEISKMLEAYIRAIETNHDIRRG
ncbi:MAG: four helix bundle protein [Verrucomicrobia bacterium]|nr:four helix bundle protein [Verrucomicrobiota bacterium]